MLYACHPWRNQMFLTRIKAIIQNCLWLVCFPVRRQGSKPWQHNQNQSSPHCRAQWFRFLLCHLSMWDHARRACSSLWIRMGSPPESPAGKLFVPPPQPASLVPIARRWSKGSHLEAHRGPAALYKVTQSSVSARLYSLNSIYSFSPTACAPSLKSGWALFHGCCAENFYA